jgi:Photosynthetic reaction centre cytochrome C subunit
MSRHLPFVIGRAAVSLVAIGICTLVSVWTLGAQPPTKSPDEDTFKPEKIDNLKVMPKTTTPDQLMKVMREWNEALNVGCVFCHKGKLGAPLTTFDFADDSKEHKEVTRSMLTMTNDLNSKYPEGMGDDASIETPKVTCAMCHRRNRHPETDLPPKTAEKG